MLPMAGEQPTTYLGRESSGMFEATAKSDPNEIPPWTEPPYMILSCCSTRAFWSESRNLKFTGRDRNDFWHFSPFLTPSAGGGKKRQAAMRVNSTFCSQDSYFSLELDSMGSILKREASSVQAF